MLKINLQDTTGGLVKNPTLLGFLALFIWSSSGTIISSSKTLPPYEMLMLVFLAACLIPLCRAFFQRRWSDFKAPLVAWVLVIVGIVLQQFMYVMAFQSIPAAEIDVLVYLWPVMALVLASTLSGQKLRTSHLVAIGFGMTSLLVLSFGRLSFDTICAGHIYAFLCAVVWSFYTVLSQRYPQINQSMLGVGYFIGFLFSFALHTQNESFALPNFNQCFTVFYIGLFGTIVAMSFWTKGVREGKSSKLIICAYFKPVLSILLLYLAGFADLSPELMIACFCVVMAGLISNVDVLDNIRTRLPKIEVKNFRTYP